MASKMAPDLLNQITNEFRGDTINRIASGIGVSAEKTQTAVGSLVPAVLSSLAGRTATTEGANDVIDVIRSNNLASLKLSDISRPEGVTNLANTGRSLMHFTFGDNVNWVTDWIASHAGISRESAASLASICVPVVLGLVGRRLGSTGLNASSLSNLLGGPSTFLQNAPAGLASALGLSGAATTARRFAGDTERRVAAAPTYPSEKGGSVWKWLLPLILGVAVIGLLAYLLSERQPAVVTSQPAAQAEVPAAPVAPAPGAPATVVPASAEPNLGTFIDTKLPNGVVLHIPSNGVENKLLAFIGDPTKDADKGTWFTFDRLEFESDSAKLKPSSHEQLANMAAILKAYPQVAVKIGGYTDNTGDAAHNLKLSQDRATTTLNELAGLGITKSRLAAEGYGQQFPVADNATPEGRQLNRRIDVRVTKK